ncbi:MAG: hypothetical protein ACLUZZ_06325 [Alistipes inops]
MSNNGNAFMASAKKSKRQQASIQHAQPEVDELVCINVRIPKSMHTKLQYHKVETGENMTVLINRLLEAEFARRRAMGNESGCTSTSMRSPMPTGTAITSVDESSPRSSVWARSSM